MYIFHTTPRLLLWKFTISHFKNYNYWFQFLWSARVELFIPLAIEPWYVILKYICLKKNTKNFLTVLKRHSLHVKIANKSQIQTHLCHNRWFAILSILCYKRNSKDYFNIGAVTRTLSKSNQSCYFSSLLTKRKKSVVQLHDFSRNKNSPIFKISWEPCGFCANAIFSWNSYEAHLN